MSKQAIILAAGKGSRMLSELPKVLHKVCGQSLILRTIYALKKAEISKQVVVVGHGKELVQEEIDSSGVSDIITAIQKEQLGTGHAAKSGLSAATEETLIILPGDVPLLCPDVISGAIIEFEKTSADILFVSFVASKPYAFGRILRDSSDKVLGICEEKDCTKEQKKIKEVNAGVYVCKKAFLEKALDSLKSNNAQSEYYLTDIVGFAAENDYKLTAFVSTNELSLAGANSRAELSVLEKIRRKEINEEFMLSGVSFEDPEAAFIDEGVQIGPDSFIGAGTRLKGKTELAEFVYIEGNSIVQDSKVGAKTKIKLSSTILDSEVGSNCSIGPCAQLRPGTKLGSDVKIGNFVETKKSILEDGVKAGHLSYLGDAEIKKNVNIGAGTITCNYDGTNKHKTIIKEDAFIGSNSCLVAPVEIGDNAYVGAGSTITKDVPDKSLAIARNRQEIKKNWKK